MKKDGRYTCEPFEFPVAFFGCGFRISFGNCKSSGYFRKRSNVKSVVNLRYFNRSGDRKVLADRGIALFNRPLLTWRITPKQVAETLYLIEQQQAEGPVLIHCYHGADRTGLIAGMYRIIYQGWTVEQAKNEMRHGPYGFHSIWRNIEDLFTEENVRQVRTHLQQLRSQPK